MKVHALLRGAKYMLYHMSKQHNDYWGEPEHAPRWAVVYICYVRHICRLWEQQNAIERPFKFCTRCERCVCGLWNNKLPLTSHSSFVYITSVACTAVNRNLTIRNMLITRGMLKMANIVCKEVDKVREERLRTRREHDRLRSQRETNEERHAKCINLCPCLSLIHILVMALHIDWLGEEQMIEIDVQSNAKS